MESNKKECNKNIDPEIIKQWNNILNPEILKSNLEFLSLYIALYEKLEDTIISRVKEYYSYEELNKVDYKKYVLSLYNHKRCPTIPKKCRILISSLIWLLEANVISDNDILIFAELKKSRNIFTHEMFSLLSEGLPKDAYHKFDEMIDLFSKIEKWWIVEMEVPMIDSLKNIDDVDLDNVMSGNMMVLHIIRNILRSGSNKDYEEVCQLLNIPIK